MSNLIFITDNENNVGIGSNMINDIKGNINITQNLNVSGNLNVINDVTINTRLGIGTTSNRITLDVGGTDGIIIPTGNTTQRPTNPILGTIRYNSLINQFEGYCAGLVGLSGGWVHLGGPNLNPYTTTDYRHYMWEADNVSGATRGDKALVTMQSLYIKGISSLAGAIMIGNLPWWTDGSTFQGNAMGSGVYSNYTDNTVPPDEHIFRIEYHGPLSQGDNTPLFNIWATEINAVITTEQNLLTAIISSNPLSQQVYITSIGSNQWEIIPQAASSYKFITLAHPTKERCTFINNPPIADAAKYTWEFNYI